MTDFMPEKSTNAVAQLKADHERARCLFERFRMADGRGEKKEIAGEACRELKIHAALEDEVFYPAIRREIDDEEIFNDVGHAAAKSLISELEAMDGSESQYEEKFSVLEKNVNDHISEEEEDLLPAMERTDIDMEVLGERMWRRRKQLIADGVPR